MNEGLNNKINQEFNIKELIGNYLKHWYWFGITLFVSLVIAYLYLMFSVPEYLANAKIQILEEGNSSPELAVFQDLDILNGSSQNKIQDEIELLGSRGNFMEVVRRLGINIKYLSIGDFKDTEIYADEPINLNFLVEDSLLYETRFKFFINISSETTYGYSETEDGQMSAHTFGDKLSTDMGDIIITPSEDFSKNYVGQKIRVEIHPIWRIAQSYKAQVKIYPSDNLSKIVNLSLRSPHKTKAQHILNELITVYNENAINDKKVISDRTIQFINDRIETIGANLSSADKIAQDFKTGNRLTDIASEANLNLQAELATDRELEQANISLSQTSAMKDLISSNTTFETLPANMGLANQTINTLSSQYNQLINERERMLKSSGVNNPMVVALDTEIDALRSSLKSTLTSMESNLTLQVNDLRSQKARISSRIYAAPGQERRLTEIEREQGTIEGLYLYLLQKREESGITLASTAPKSRIIENAHSASEFPVSPKRTMVYLAAFVIGLLVPFAVIYLSELLDTKIHSKQDLQKYISSDIPVLVDIPTISKKVNSDHIITKYDRSVSAESFRILRTNLDYLIKSKSSYKKNNVIFVTSTTPEEGKTFLSTNLAAVYSMTKKKVLLIEGDIRSPKLYTFLMKKNFVEKEEIIKNKVRGLTEFLFNENLKPKDIINENVDLNGNLVDVVYSGKIPPNPAELLLNNRLDDFFEFAKEQYDYVIMDTAPVLVVSDTLLISKYADHTVYVVRGGVTERKVINYPLDLFSNKKINGLAFVVNDVKSGHLGYGTGYGYGYGMKETNLLSRIKDFIFKKILRFKKSPI